MISFNTSNTSVIMKGNEIYRDSASYLKYDGNAGNYAMDFYADHYDLVMEDNTIVNANTAYKCAIGIYGNYSDKPGVGFQDNATWNNSIQLKRGQKANYFETLGNSVFKIWNDVTYAPVEWPSDYRITDETKALAYQLFDSSIAETCAKEAPDKNIAIFEILCRATNKSDLDATEKSFAPLTAIWNELNPNNQY